jgi:hypothetical protein
MASWLDVSDTTPRIAYTAGAGQIVFTVPFLFFANSDLKVYVNGSLQLLSTHYNVSGALNPTGGTVTFLTAPATGAGVLIVRDLPIALTTHIPPSGPLDIAGLNNQFSRTTAQLQQVKDLFQRALTLPLSDPVTNLTVPNQQVRAGAVLGFDASGNPIATTPAFAVMGVGQLGQVRAASTGNINLAAPGATIDSVTMSAGQTFLAKDQSTAADNGVYTWNGAATPATRTTQFDTYAELVAAWISVTEGSINAGTLWVNVNGASGTLGVTAIVFVRTTLGINDVGPLSTVTGASAAVGVNDAIVTIERVAPTATSLALPNTAFRGGRELLIADLSTGITDPTGHTITLTPDGAEKIMNASSWPLFSNSVSLASIRLTPVPSKSTWIIG